MGQVGEQDKEGSEGAEGGASDTGSAVGEVESDSGASASRHPSGGGRGVRSSGGGSMGNGVAAASGTWTGGMAAAAGAAVGPSGGPEGGIKKTDVVGLAGELFAYHALSSMIPGFTPECWVSSGRAQLGLGLPLQEPPFDFRWVAWLDFIKALLPCAASPMLCMLRSP